MKYRVKVSIGNGREYAGNALTFDSLAAADEYASELLSRWTLPDGWIVEALGRDDLYEWTEWTMIATRTAAGARLDLFRRVCETCRAGSDPTSILELDDHDCDAPGACACICRMAGANA